MRRGYAFTLTVIFIMMALLFTCSGIKNAQGAELTAIEQLGKNIFFDRISSPDSMSCADCHAPSVGWTGPIPGINLHGAVYRGAVPNRFGNRKPPSSGYATLSPVFHYNVEEGIFIGGNFWDGRATGEGLGNPAADQALGPFLNPVEQNNPSKKAVLEQIADSRYAWLWEAVWGEPISTESDVKIDENYDRIGLSIAAYEDSNEVNQYSSKYDYFLIGEVELTELERWGLELFNGKAQCSACHPSLGIDDNPPLFTDFTFDNLGVPKNPKNPFYEMDKVYLDDGTPINPEGKDWIDQGLGGFLATLSEEYFEAIDLNKADAVAENIGKHKVPTLRNVGKRPGEYLPKAYSHNGVFKSLKEIVHFYNTRDIEVWPDPEVWENINTDELGNLGLTEEEEEAIVAFMLTLSDGYSPPKKGSSHSLPFILVISPSTVNSAGSKNGTQIVTLPQWNNSGYGGPLWYGNTPDWSIQENGGAWWWLAPLGVGQIGHVWYKNQAGGLYWL